MNLRLAHRSSGAGRWTGLALLTLSASKAQAHLVTTGLGPFYDGLGHLFLTPEDWLLVLAVALLGGLQGPQAGRRILGLLPLAWFAAGLLSPAAAGGLPAFVPPALLICLGALSAVDLKFGPRFIAFVAVVAGSVHGWQNGLSLQLSSGFYLILLGIALACCVVTALMAGLAVKASGGWQRIVARVAGSWIAATGLLMLGWSLRKA